MSFVELAMNSSWDRLFLLRIEAVLLEFGLSLALNSITLSHFTFLLLVSLLKWEESTRGCFQH